mgnify:CR=1 FL=1
MSNTKFTSGEWSQSHREDKKTGMYSTEVYDSRGQTICTLSWHTEPGSTRTDRPENAQLIAAAPAMYAMIETIAINMHKTNSGSIEDILAIESLLKKARGE